MAKYYDKQMYDFRKFNDHFNASLIKELDFENEVGNLEYCRECFRTDKDVYIPETYTDQSSKRVIIMEFINGVKIDDLESIEDRFGKGAPKEACNILNKVFSDMIFKFGFVHCDAHPGNIFVRENPDVAKRPQVVLLDHGFYCKLPEEFRQDFCNMWYSLNTMDYENVKNLAHKMGIG